MKKIIYEGENNQFLLEELEKSLKDIKERKLQVTEFKIETREVI